MAVSEDECSSAKSRSSSSASSSSTHYLAKCVLRGSVVLQVLYGHIRSPASLDVVFGKETSIELVIIGEDGIVQSVCEQPVFGTIKDIAILPWNEKFHVRNPQMLGKDILVVISDSGKLSFLTFCYEMHRFFPLAHVQLSDPGNSRWQLGRMLAVDSSGCFIAASAYVDRLALLSVSVSDGSDIIDEVFSVSMSDDSDKMLGKDILVVISDSGKLSFLTFCYEMHRFFPLAHVQLSDPGNSRWQLGRMLAVDSSGCFIAASAYVDRLALLSVSVSDGSDIIDEVFSVSMSDDSDKRIIYPSEHEGDASIARNIRKNGIRGTIWGMCFISQDASQPSKEHHPVLAILLNRPGEVLNELLLLRWNVRECALYVLSRYLEAGPLAHNIVEVPHCHGFAFLFRVGDALLMDLRDANKPCCVYRTSLNFLPNAVDEHNFVEDSIRVQDVDDEGLCNVAACALLELRDYDPMCIDGDTGNVNSTYKHICSWSWEPEKHQNPRLIFCVDSGEFFMIEICFDSDGLKVNLSECLYKGLPCKALLWVHGGYLAALVEMGDGMVLALESGGLHYTSPIQNIAPILDMSVVDYHDEKHDQIVAPEGSLRIIRSGISVEKLLRTAPIYQGITGTWTVRMKVTDSYHSFLVLSFVEETRVLSVGLSFTDVTDSVGFKPDVCTLACGLVSDGLLVQIDQNAVRLCLPTCFLRTPLSLHVMVPRKCISLLDIT
ncbi:DNA damage-binding protein 1 [Morella rubra]|uniref:DNA damage-binding protein 1 n=1 Tax=Morella rubra TaxID=262757 RepID=A0A6A1WAZ9_9ROSI|nr:DNA damage-binding protein 1 [Morella rubra]